MAKAQAGKCLIENCVNSGPLRKGYCGTHYQRLRRTGTAEKRRQGEIYSDGKYYKQWTNGEKKHIHVRIAETVLGKSLPVGAVVHHINGDGHDNRNINLVICKDQAYHMLLHIRQRALDACGNADYRRCRYCHEYDAQENMATRLEKNRVSPSFYHKSCAAKASLTSYKKNKFIPGVHPL